MDLSPFISVIINCHNGSKYLTEAIDSVIDQKYNNFEIIFWDNFSTDNSVEIIQSYNDSRIHIFQSKVLTSLGEARNLAVEEAQGKWIAFLDCDDLWSNEKLYKQIKTYNTSNIVDSIGLIYCATELIYASDHSNIDSAWNKMLKNFNLRNSPKNLLNGKVYKDLLKRNFIPLVSALIKKDIYTELKGIDSTLTQSEDYDLFLKITNKYNILCVREVLCFYRIHNSNQTSTNLELNFYEDGYILAKQNTTSFYKLYFALVFFIKSLFVSIKNRNINILVSSFRGYLSFFKGNSS